MKKSFKAKVYKWLVPISCVIMNTSMVFADDEITRKMEKGKTWAMGIITVAAFINAAYSIYAAGAAKGQSEIEMAEKRRKNALVAAAGVLVLDVLVALWKSW